MTEMPAPIVHIGFHKTATSWFQTCVYPKVVSHRMIDRDLIRSLFVDGEAFRFDAARARQLLGIDAGALPPLLCEEELSGILHIGSASTYIAKEVAGRLHATLPEAKIVIFIRSQVEAAASWYTQYLKEGGTASVRRYLFPDEYVFPGRLMQFKMARFDFAQLDYSGLVGTYDRLFGPENVHVFPYEDLLRDPLAVVSELKERLGFELSPGDISTGAVNSSLRKGVIPIARTLNLFSARGVANKRTLVHLPYGRRSARFILAKLNRIPVFGPRSHAASLIDATTRKWIAQRFADSNRWLEERLERRLDVLGYGVETPSPPAAPPTRSRLVRWSRK
jgi:hypothetical protein